MSKYRSALPQMTKPFIADGGLETTMIFHKGVELPHFASIVMMRTPEGRRMLRENSELYMPLAKAARVGFLAEAPTWRASRDWCEKLGLVEEMESLNRASIAMLMDLRRDHESEHTPIVVGGVVGPRGDGYRPGAHMSTAEAEAYHEEQIAIFADTEADHVAAYTLSYVEEAIGIARAARRLGMPSAISFTLETDGKLPSGQALGEAITMVDDATDGAPAYFMINCAHPTHFSAMLAAGGSWLGRIRGLRANSSMRSHAELDNSPELDEGNPAELGAQYRALRPMLPNLTIFAGCCGTDHRHVAAIAESCFGHAHDRAERHAFAA